MRFPSHSHRRGAPGAFIVTLLCGLLPSVVHAAPTPAPDEAAQEAAIVRREAPEAFELKGRSVRRVLPLVPHIWLVEFGGEDVPRQAMVLDGHIVRGRSLAIVGRYLAATQFLEARDPRLAARLAGIINEWGEEPLGFDKIDITESGVRPSDTGTLLFKDGGALLTVYGRWQKAPKRPESKALGGPVKVELGPPQILRAILHVKRGYKLNWTVEQTSAETPGRWRPFSG